MRQPSVAAIWAATTRLMMSGGVPGGVGTTMRITPGGNAWAWAVVVDPNPTDASKKQAPCTKRRTVTIGVSRAEPGIHPEGCPSALIQLSSIFLLPYSFFEYEAECSAPRRSAAVLSFGNSRH